MTAPIVRFIGVTKQFGTTRVLDGIDLDVAPMERIAIIGPSGSGKSTLLRTLMTLEPIDAGVIEIGGEPVWHRRRQGRLVPADEAHLRRVRGMVGMVFQQFNLFPHMTALGNVKDPLKAVKGKSDAEATAIAEEVLGLVGLSDKLWHYPKQLSGGQQQRVAIARALAMRPKLMLFDEITSALDPELVGEVLRVLRMLAERHDLTMLMVTHQMHFARDIADRVLFLDRGRIVEEGPPDQILLNPQNERTRSFLKTVLEA